jgi:hypothetical protein
MKTSDFRIVLIALGLGKIMHEHRAEGPITLLVQQGLIRLKEMNPAPRFAAQIRHQKDKTSVLTPEEARMPTKKHHAPILLQI